MDYAPVKETQLLVGIRGEISGRQLSLHEQTFNEKR